MSENKMLELLHLLVDITARVEALEAEQRDRETAQAERMERGEG